MCGRHRTERVRTRKLRILLPLRYAAGDDSERRVVGQFGVCHRNHLTHHSARRRVTMGRKAPPCNLHGKKRKLGQNSYVFGLKAGILFRIRHGLPVYCVQSWHASWICHEVAIPAGALHAANRGVNAGDDIAPNKRQTLILSGELGYWASPTVPGNIASNTLPYVFIWMGVLTLKGQAGRTKTALTPAALAMLAAAGAAWGAASMIANPIPSLRAASSTRLRSDTSAVATTGPCSGHASPPHRRELLRVGVD